jgi:hypothetical protein
VRASFTMMFHSKIVACVLLWSGSAVGEVTPAGVSCLDLTLTGNGAADTTTTGNCCKGGGPSVSFSEGVTCPDGVQGTVVNGEFVPDATSPSTTSTTTTSTSSACTINCGTAVTCADMPIPNTETGGNCCKDGSGITATESGGIICPNGGVQGTVVNGEFVPDDASTTSTTTTTTTSSVSTTSGETGCDVTSVACGTKCTPDPTSTCKDGQCLDLFGVAISCAEPASTGSTTTTSSVGGSTSNVSNNNQVGFGTDINQGDVTTPSIDAGETDEAIAASDAFHVKAAATAMSLVILAVVGIN